MLCTNTRVTCILQRVLSCRSQCNVDECATGVLSQADMPIIIMQKADDQNSKLTAEMAKLQCAFCAVHIRRYIGARGAFYAIREEQIVSPSRVPHANGVCVSSLSAAFASMRLYSTGIGNIRPLIYPAIVGMT